MLGQGKGDRAVLHTILVRSFTSGHPVSGPWLHFCTKPLRLSGLVLIWWAISIDRLQRERLLLRPTQQY